MIQMLQRPVNRQCIRGQSVLSVKHLCFHVSQTKGPSRFFCSAELTGTGPSSFCSQTYPLLCPPNHRTEIRKKEYLILNDAPGVRFIIMILHVLGNVRIFSHNYPNMAKRNWECRPVNASMSNSCGAHSVRNTFPDFASQLYSIVLYNVATASQSLCLD